MSDLIFGVACPSGKLAETFPLAAEDCASHAYFMNHPSQLIYREGLNVGYRYFETYSRPVLFPFGYGLSYTTFAYSSMTLSSRDLAQGDSLTLSLDVTNTGTVEGAEVVQIYVRDLEASVHRPALELRDFGKTEPLPPGASQTLHFVLPPRAFAFYDVAAHDWYVEPGAFEVLAAAAVNDARLTERVEVSGAVRAEVGGAAVGRYETLSNGQLEALGVRVRPPPPPYPLHRTSLVKEVAEHGGCFGRLVYRILLAGNGVVDDPGEQRSREEMLKAMPLQQLMRFAHCNSVAARYLFTESVLGCLIAGFNCSGGGRRSALHEGGVADGHVPVVMKGVTEESAA